HFMATGTVRGTISILGWLSESAIHSSGGLFSIIFSFSTKTAISKHEIMCTPIREALLIALCAFSPKLSDPLAQKMRAWVSKRIIQGLPKCQRPAELQYLL